MTASFSINTIQSDGEQRSDTRLPVLLPAFVEVGGKNYSVCVINLALSGAMIETSAPVTVRSRVTFRCGTISIQATIAWQAKGRTGLRFSRVLTNADVAEQVYRSSAVAARRAAQRSVGLELVRRSSAPPETEPDPSSIKAAALAPPPTSNGKQAAEFNRMQEQHSLLMVLVRELSRLTSQIDPPCRVELSRVRRSLASDLIRHLKEEDWVVYPTLLQSADSARREASRALQVETGTLAETFGQYMSKWNAIAIEQDWPNYRRETSHILTALKRRITREDTQLYGAIANGPSDKPHLARG